MPGTTAVGHVRYSTTGETILRNVQPLFAELNAGGFAIGHNGNLTNGITLRLGQKTDTQDVWGRTLATAEVDLDAAAVTRTLEGMAGPRLQVPPMTSAVKKDDKRATCGS